MKFKVAKKQIQQDYYCFKIGYCELQSLFYDSATEIVLYTQGKYGWNCDIYTRRNIAITTGYRPFGTNIKKVIPDINKYEFAAQAANAFTAINTTDNKYNREKAKQKLRDEIFDKLDTYIEKDRLNYT